MFLGFAQKRRNIFNSPWRIQVYLGSRLSKIHFLALVCILLYPNINAHASARLHSSQTR